MEAAQTTSSVAGIYGGSDWEVRHNQTQPNPNPSPRPRPRLTPIPTPALPPPPTEQVLSATVDHKEGDLEVSFRIEMRRASASVVFKVPWLGLGLG